MGKENLSTNHTQAKMVKAQKSFSQKSILGGRVLRFKQQESQPVLGVTEKFKSKVTYQTDCDNDLITFTGTMVNHPEARGEIKAKPRKIPQNPYRVLQAPGLCDDFYLNLIDWSCKNVLAVALEGMVYVWNATTSSVKELCNVGDYDQVTSLGWSNNGNYLSVGTRSGDIQIWDVVAQKRVRTMGGHDARVSSIAWNNTMPSVLASGSKDKTILVRDLRQSQNGYMRLMDHRQEVCGLRWSLHDENQLASGGNDNKMFIWSPT